MEFVQGRRERHLCEEEDPYFAHHPSPFTLQRPPLPSSSSSSSSSSARWVPQQMDSTDDHPHQVASSSVAGGAPPQQQQRLAAAFVEKEHMFDKVVTPSDVGKLNRLVIPKQHAEKYFPLDSSSNEKGLLLNFEDRTGKQWRFRYSYWNSSQSYVMTKGWSRFVKEKRLDAGDTVSFGRGVGEAGRDRLFIDWKRRPEPLRVPGRFPLPSQAYHFGHHHDLPAPMMSFARSVPPWGRLVTPPASATAPSIAIYDHHRHQLGNGYHAPSPASNPFWYLRSAGTASVQFGGGGSGDRAVPVVLDSVPLVPSNAAAAAKRVRLFGVNLDCSAPEEAADAMAQRGYPRPPPLPPVQLRLGVSDMVESPRKDKQPMSLDLGM